MKLTTRMLILVAVVMLLAITASLFLLSANRQLAEALTTSEAIDDSVGGMVELSILTSDYLLSPSERASSQWFSTHSSIVESLTAITVSNSEMQVLVGNALQILDKIHEIFTQLVKNKQQPGSAQSEVAQELEVRLTGQISVELQRLLTTSNKLKVMNKIALDSASSTSNIVGITLLSLLFFTILAFYLTTNISILRPISALTEIAENVAEGDLNVGFPEIEKKNEIGVLSRAFRDMTAQLRELIASLEQQVADRTQALETSTEVSRRLSTILDQEQLVREVVEQLRSAFGYYHAQIYLYDDAKQSLEMVGGTGEAGRAMLAQSHKIEPGRGLVGRAAKDKVVVLIPDVSQAEGWLPNPLLPDTKAEVAVPIAIGGDVLGVLDVQHNIADGLNSQDADLIQAIAGQVAIAVQNAQAYTRTHQQATQEARLTAISQRIQSATSIPDVLQIAVSELGQVLDAQRSSVELHVRSQSDNGRD